MKAASVVCRSWSRALRNPSICNAERTRLSSLRARRPSEARNSSSWSNSGRKNQDRRSRNTRRIVLLSGGAATGATVLAFTDDIKASYDAVERSGRVAVALAICINDYRKTLNEKDQLEDPEEGQRVLRACHQRCAERTLKVLEKNGGIFIKLGQHLSAMNYLLPTEWTTTFIPLQDNCPVSSIESIRAMFEHDTGRKLEDYFSEFSEKPLGAASLAQVHIAVIKETGQEVAVKVQHPGLAQWAPLDLSLTRYTFATLKRFFPEYDLEWLSSEMDVSLPKELDFREEAKNANRTRDYFARLPGLPLVIPDVLWAEERIIVMRKESGQRLDNLAYMDESGIDRDEVSAALSHIFNEMIFGDNAPLHCDPHGGNLAIRKNDSRRRGRYNFDIILYDHGLYRDISLPLRRSYAHMWLAIIDGDIPKMRRYAAEVAGVTDEEFPLFASAITGRDYSVLESQGSVLRANRDQEEKKTISTALQEGLLVDLVGLLGRVPRIILLILKTNDLTRSLDENLQTREGPVRTFLIMARYCAKTVFHEQVDEIGSRGSFLWPLNALSLVFAWLGFVGVEMKLGMFETWLGVRRHFGIGGSGTGIPLGA